MAEEDSQVWVVNSKGKFVKPKHKDCICCGQCDGSDEDDDFSDEDFDDADDAETEEAETETDEEEEPFIPEVRKDVFVPMTFGQDPKRLKESLKDDIGFAPMIFSKDDPDAICSICGQLIAPNDITITLVTWQRLYAKPPQKRHRKRQPHKGYPLYGTPHTIHFNCLTFGIVQNEEETEAP